MRLPSPPSGDRYLTQLVRKLNDELDARPAMVDGAVEVSENRPLRILAGDNRRYRVEIDSDGSLTTVEE